MLIAVEGIDGSGKTSVIKFVKEELKKRGFDVVVFKEPTKSEWGMRVMTSGDLKPEEELELFILDRKYDVEKNILPALKENKIVLMDRYYYSTIAYQGALGLDIKEIRKRNEEIAPKPDLVIFLDIDPLKAIKRVKGRGKPDRFEDIEYLKKVREIFLSLKFVSEADNIVASPMRLSNEMIVINADESPEIVRKKVLECVLDILT